MLATTEWKMVLIRNGKIYLLLDLINAARDPQPAGAAGGR